MSAHTKNKKLGFTLIELLVVISIISLLSSVIIAALNNARSKAKLSNVKQLMVQLRNEMILYYSNNGVYGLDANAACLGNSGNYGFHTPTAQKIITAIIAANPLGNGVNCYVRNNGQDFAIYTQVFTPAPRFYCMDGKGKFVNNDDGDWVSEGDIHLGYCR